MPRAAVPALLSGRRASTVLLALSVLGGSLSLLSCYLAYMRLQEQQRRRDGGVEDRPADLELEPPEPRRACHGSPESASPETARSRHHRILSQWREEQSRDDTGKVIEEVLSLLESENLRESALEGVRERLATLEDKVAAQSELISHLESSFVDVLHKHKQTMEQELAKMKREVNGVKNDLKTLSELGEELAEKENLLEEKINVGSQFKVNQQQGPPLAMIKSPPRTPPRTPPLSPRRVYVTDWADF